MSGSLNSEGFLRRFFGEGNRLGPQDGKAPYGKKLRPWTDRVTADNDHLLLPRAVGTPPQVTWYAIAKSAAEARLFREELRAAVGLSYSDFSGVTAPLDPADPIEKAIGEFAGPHVFKLRLIDPDLAESCNKALLRLVRLREERPRRESRRARSRGRILRDFESALTTADRDGVDAALEELRTQGHLDAQNVLFLRIRAWERFENWDALNAQLEAGNILSLRRPRGTTQALIRALYREEFIQFEEDFRAPEAVAHLEQLLPTFASLLTSREAMPASEVAKLFMLKAAVTEDSFLKSAILQGVVLPPADAAYLSAIAELVRERKAEDSTDDLAAAFMSGNMDRAFQLLEKGKGGEQRVQLLVRCARSVGSLHAATVALEAYYALDTDAQSALRDGTHLADALQELEQQFTATETPEVSRHLPSGWKEWAEHLVEGRLTSNAAQEIARLGAEEWSRKDLAQRPGDVMSFAELLVQIPETDEEKRRLALPHIKAFFATEPTLPAFRPVLRTLLFLYAIDDERSLPMYRATLEVLASLLAMGVNDDELADVIDELGAMVDTKLSVDFLDWALDFLELLVTKSSASPEPTIRVASLVFQYLLRWKERLMEEHVVVFNQLCRELDCDLILDPPSDDAEPVETTLADAIRGRTVAMYSLNERAMTRVERVLRELCPDVKVQTFHDKAGGSPALREAARTADVFLIVTAAAKHAATGFIEGHRSADALTVRSHAQGSASMLRALQDRRSEISEL